MPFIPKLKQNLENPVLFNLLQFVICGRQKRTRDLIRRGLQPSKEDRVLDVGCGTGEFSDIALGCYVGLDIEPRYIDYANARHGLGAGHSNREFRCFDLTKYQGPAFSKSMMINCMHHLSDGQNRAILGAIARVTTERFVLVDMDPAPRNPVSRFLAKHDRGEYLRPLNAQAALVETYFTVESARHYYSGFCAQTIVVSRK